MRHDEIKQVGLYKKQSNYGARRCMDSKRLHTEDEDSTMYNDIYMQAAAFCNLAYAYVKLNAVVFQTG